MIPGRAPLRAGAPLVLALAVLGGSAAGCCSCGSPTFTVRSRDARAVATVPPPTGPLLRVLHLADFGDETCQQSAVADGVAAAHRKAPFDLAVFPGDLVYDCGPNPELPGAEACTFEADGATVTPGYVPPADPLYQRHEGPLAPLAAPPAVEVLVSIGNHDIGDPASCAGNLDPQVARRRRACLNVAHRSPLWRMDGRHFVADRGQARFLFLDSNLLRADYGGFTLQGEVGFVQSAAQGCRPDACEAEPGGCEKPWCFVVSHHPAATAGDHAGDHTPEYVSRVARVLEAGGGRIRAWLSGHDHDLQHLRAPSGLDVFVSGNGARGRDHERFERPVPSGTSLVFASVHWGHGVLEVGRDGWRYRFESDSGEALHCCAAAGAGRCEPAGCPR